MNAPNAMTTRDVAAKLLAMPNVRLVVEGWTHGEILPVMTDYDPNGTAILVNGHHYKPTDVEPVPN